MKSRDIIFSIIFLFLTYQTVTNSSFLFFKTNSNDLFYFVLISLAALVMAITSIIDLKRLKEKNIKSKISLLFCFISSMLYILVTAFYIITNRIEMIV